jgi:hypothetical protein
MSHLTVGALLVLLVLAVMACKADVLVGERRFDADAVSADADADGDEDLDGDSEADVDEQ